MRKDFKETDMFCPVKDYFEQQGYVVNSEVKHCDLTAVKENELIIGEIKKSFNMKLLYQLLDRQKFTDIVFAIIPRPTGRQQKDFANMKYVLKALNIGLITVAMDSPLKYVEMIMLPECMKTKQNQKRRERLLRELDGRTADYNTGGSNKVKIVTAYREKSIKILCLLEKEKECSPAILIKKYGLEKDTGRILNTNTYGWFEKKSRGLYCLSNCGKDQLINPEFPKIVNYYRKEI